MTETPSQPPDFAALAQQYLDLWEDQLAAMAANPDLAEQGARVFEALSRFGTAASPMAATGLAAMLSGAGLPGAGMPFPGMTMAGMAGAADPPGGDGDRTTAGTAAAAAADGDRDRRMDELAGRLAVLEERLARLEAGGGGAGKRTGGGGRTRAGTGGGRRKPAGARSRDGGDTDNS